MPVLPEVGSTSVPPGFNVPAIHYATTGPEIWADTDGQVDAFIAGVGTGGTLSGAGKFLKEKNPDCQIIAVEPVGSPMISEGTKGPHKIQGIGAGFIPENLDTDLIDDVVTIESEAAFGTAKHVTAEDGVPIGISAGAAVAAAMIVGARPNMRGKRVVTIIPSFAERYLSRHYLQMSRSMRFGAHSRTAPQIMAQA